LRVAVVLLVSTRHVATSFTVCHLSKGQQQKLQQERSGVSTFLTMDGPLVVIDKRRMTKRSFFVLNAMNNDNNKGEDNRISTSTTTTRTTTTFSTLVEDDDEEYNISIASAFDVQNAMDDPNAIVLDVRSVDEIIEQGHLQVDRQWIHAECTCSPGGWQQQDACPLLRVAAESLIPDKSTPVIVYSTTWGKRAALAKQILHQKGYTHVLNAGAFSNLGYLQIYKDANI